MDNLVALAKDKDDARHEYERWDVTKIIIKNVEEHVRFDLGQRRAKNKWYAACYAYEAALDDVLNDEKTESILADLTGTIYSLLDENRKTAVEPFLKYLHEMICNVRLARSGSPTRETPERPSPISKSDHNNT